MRAAVVLMIAGLMSACVTEAKAAWPFPATPSPLHAPPTMLSATGEGELLVGRRGAVLRLSTEHDGSLAVQETILLPASAEPIDAVVQGEEALVLDATTSSLLIFEETASAHRLVATLAVGPEPVDLAATDDYIAVANAGSDDVSLFTHQDDNRGSYATAGRVAVGSRPRAIVSGDFAGDHGEDLAVANAGAGTVTVLAHHARRGFRRAAEISIGGAPHAMTVGSSRLRGDTVVVGPTGDNSLVELATSRGQLRRKRTIRVPLAVEPLAIALGMATDEERYGDLAVADARAGGVWVLRGGRDGFAPPTLLNEGTTPIAVTAGFFGGDFQGDFAVIDARSQTASLLITPGDRLLSPPGEQVEMLAAGGGRVVWSRRAGAGDHRLVLWRSDGARDLPIRSSRRPLAVSIGRLSSKRPAAAYVRCGGRTCAAYAWDFTRGRERSLKLGVPDECAVKQVAVWDRHLAYILRRPWNSRCHATGLWLQSRGKRPRLIDRTGHFGALVGGKLAWLDMDTSGDSWKIRVRTLGGRTRTVTSGDLDCCNESTPRLSGGVVYFTTVGIDGAPVLTLHADPAPSSRCPSARRDLAWFDGVPAADEFGYTAHFAVDGRRIYYADPRGVWRVDPERLRWRCARSSAG